MTEIFDLYLKNLASVINLDLSDKAGQLSRELRKVWESRGRLFICGNGGSAANAIHIANDFIHGVAENFTRGIDVEALTSNVSVLTCFANDFSYSEIFSRQLKTKAKAGDMLLVLSGSGNSENIVQAVTEAKKLGVFTIGITGFDGGVCKSMLDLALHFEIYDMQVAEDMQIILGHMCMRWLKLNPPEIGS